MHRFCVYDHSHIKDKNCTKWPWITCMWINCVNFCYPQTFQDEKDSRNWQYTNAVGNILCKLGLLIHACLKYNLAPDFNVSQEIIL